MGENNPGSKLTEEDVKNIRIDSLIGATDAAQAERYAVTQATIRRIIDGKTWKHVVINVNIDASIDELTLNVGIDEEE